MSIIGPRVSEILACWQIEERRRRRKKKKKEEEERRRKKLMQYKTMPRCAGRVKKYIFLRSAMLSAFTLLVLTSVQTYLYICRIIPSATFWASWNTANASSISSSHFKNALKDLMPIAFSSPRAQPEVVYFLISNESPYFSYCKSTISASNSL